MIGDSTALGVIAARGGSKGLPRKNVLPLAGRPMIAWSVAAGQESRHLDRLILSSDDREIIDTARAAGCEAPFVRPRELAGDDISVVPALVHALDALGESYDFIVLLQATSPLRRGADIDACLELAADTGAPAVIAVTRPAKSPYWMVKLDNESRMQRVVEPPAENRAHARQLLPDVYVPNGAVYVARTGWLRETGTFVSPDTRAYVMPQERSVDIDTRIDFLLAEALLADAS